MTLDRNLLFYFVKDALAPYSENFRITDRHNPVRIRLNAVDYSVHVSYVHDSGNARDNDDEVRIQLGRRLIDEQRERQDGGDRVAFIGFFDTGDTLVTWDPRHVFSLQAKTGVSVYARQSQRSSVTADQAAVHQFMAQKLGEQSFAIALPASVLGFYLENIERFHAMRSERSIINLVAHHAETFSDSGLGERVGSILMIMEHVRNSPLSETHIPGIRASKRRCWKHTGRHAASATVSLELFRQLT